MRFIFTHKPPMCVPVPSQGLEGRFPRRPWSKNDRGTVWIIFQKWSAKKCLPSRISKSDNRDWVIWFGAPWCRGLWCGRLTCLRDKMALDSSSVILEFSTLWSLKYSNTVVWMQRLTCATIVENCKQLCHMNIILICNSKHFWHMNSFYFCFSVAQRVLNIVHWFERSNRILIQRIQKFLFVYGVFRCFTARSR